MPEKEFEIYLSLLSRLMRLSPAQKSAISDELRDHLEQRLSDLLQSGMSRDEAILAAMDEFGDVSGLALDMTRVSRVPIRTVVVRSSLALSAVAVVAICCMVLFAPEHRAVTPVPAQAQDPKAKATKPEAERAIAPRDAELFPEFLGKSLDVEFVDSPLQEVCRYLEEVVQVPVLIHKSALTEEGISLDQQVTLTLKGLTFEEVLNHLTHHNGLTWQVEGDLVRITTRSAAPLITRHFNMRKLTRQGHSLTALQDVIRCAADGWQGESDTPGTMAVVGDSIVIRQTYHNQRRIAWLLAAIEQPPQSRFAIGTCTAREALMQALQEPSEGDFNETPLQEVVEFLGERHKVQIRLDKSALEEEGVQPDVTVTLSVRNRPLGKLLDLLLAEHRLTYVIRDGVIRITTASAADSDLSFVVYHILEMAPTEELQTQLSNALLQTTANSRWAEVDGEGGAIVRTDVGGYLIVKQTDHVQWEIQTLLDQLQQSRDEAQAGESGKTPVPKLVTKTYRLPRDVAADLKTTLPSLVAPENWTTENGEQRTIHLVASTPYLETVEGVVSGGADEVQVVHPPVEKGGRSEPGPAKSIVVRPRSVLIIRQSPQVHREIQKFLNSLQIAVEFGTTDGQPLPMVGGGGGFF